MINRKIFFTIVLLIITVQIAFSQTGEDIVLNDSQNAESEFDVAMNPLDSNNIVLVTMSSDGDKSDIVIYYSNDFGVSWNKSDFTGLYGDYVSVSDPVIEFDATGIAYIVYLGEKNFISFPEKLEVDYDTKYLKSENNGASWEILEVVAETGDKPWMVIDTFTQSPFKGNKYISGGGYGKSVWCQTISDHNVRKYETDIDFIYGFEGMGLPCNAISKDGTVYMVYNHLVPLQSDRLKHIDSMVVVRSYDGGKSFGQIRKDRNLITYFEGLPRKIFGVSDRMSPKQYLAIDNSGGEYDGRIYLTYTNRERENSLFLDVFLTYSDDEGETWSIPKPIHEDALGYTNQFFSSIFVNNKGYLMLDWYDNRDDDFGKSNDFYFGLSKDGGQSFKTVKLTRESSDFTKNGSINKGFGIGDYHQCIATDHIAFSFWADGRTNDGDLDIYFAKIDLNNIDSIIISKIEEDITINYFYPNPVYDKLVIDFSVKRDMDIKWQIFDNNSKLIRQSSFNPFMPVKNKIDVSFIDLPTAVYYLRLVSKEGLMKSIKIMKN